MQVEVHIRNGRTAFRFAKRSDFRRVLRQDPDHEGGRVLAQIKHHPDNPTWETASVRSLHPNSVSFVLEVPKDQPVSFPHENGESNG
jgi:hypothetical protein